MCVCAQHKNGGRLDSWMDECAHHMCALPSRMHTVYGKHIWFGRANERVSKQEPATEWASEGEKRMQCSYVCGVCAKCYSFNNSLYPITKDRSAILFRSIIGVFNRWLYLLTRWIKNHYHRSITSTKKHIYAQRAHTFATHPWHGIRNEWKITKLKSNIGNEFNNNSNNDLHIL